MSLTGKRGCRIRHELAKAQRFLCCYCKRRFAKKGSRLAATIEHLKPRMDGGTDRRENLAAACLHCNQHRGRQQHRARQKASRPTSPSPTR